jgi:hypothetical protein
MSDWSAKVSHHNIRVPMIIHFSSEQQKYHNRYLKERSNTSEVYALNIKTARPLAPPLIESLTASTSI